MATALWRGSGVVPNRPLDASSATVRRTLYLSDATLGLLPRAVLIGPPRSAHIRAALKVYLDCLERSGESLPARAAGRPAPGLADLVAVPLKLPADLLARASRFWGGRRAEGRPFRSLSDLTRAALEYVAARTAG